MGWTSTAAPGQSAKGRLPYAVADTGQVRCYSDDREIEYPEAGAKWFGQDAQWEGNVPSYRDNGDGTITDLNTGLTWQGDPGAKMTLKQAVAGAAKCRLGGCRDWRLPTIKELYSLILFSGTDPDPRAGSAARQRPFIDTKHFKFRYGDTSRGERIIDSQFATCTKYVSTTMRSDETMFGVNFADGRIKGYGVYSRRMRRDKTFHVLYVRGNPDYGKNAFADNGDGTIADQATGLTWMKIDSGALKAGPKKDGKMNWAEALKWAEDLEYAGRSDWRLPSVKELQSIVDYTRSPATTNSAAIDPVFEATAYKAEGGKTDFGCYWTGTTHAGLSRVSAACYVAFGRSLGWMPDRQTGGHILLDVHGAGSQRSDPKSGDPSRFPHGRGPQGDVVRINNFVRCVRGGAARRRPSGPKVEMAEPPQRRGGRREGPDGQGRPGGGGGEQGPGGGNFVRRLDRDGDGKVSRREFDGPPRRFDVLDRNGDGYISAGEAPQGPPRRRRGPAIRNRPASTEGAAAAAAAVTAAALPRGTKAKPGRPNIVFILSDDQGWNGLSVRMHPEVDGSASDYCRTPNLSALAAEGLRFSDAYCPAPMCTPSRASFLTGKTPARLGMTNVGRTRRAREWEKLVQAPSTSRLPARETTIGEVLRRQGYATACFGKWHLGPAGPGEHGFDEHDGPTGNQDGEWAEGNPKDIFGITKRGSEFMARSVKAGRPFYVQLWHYAVHTPVEGLSKTVRAAENRAAGKVHSNPTFAAMTEDLDTGVGLILEKIRELGIADSTYVVYMSDNGGGRHSPSTPLAGGKGSLAEGGIRVPLIIAGPGVEAGFRRQRVAGWDLFATFCDLAGVEDPPKDTDGGSLVPLFASADAAVKRPREEMVFHFPHYGLGRRARGPQSAVYMGDYKLMKLYETDTLQLFDVAEDVGERRDLSKELPHKVEELHKRLVAYLRAVGAGAPTPNPDYDPTAPVRRMPPPPPPIQRKRRLRMSGPAIESPGRPTAAVGQGLSGNPD